MNLGPHVIGTPANLPALMNAARPAVAKYLDPGGPVVMAPITVGRMHGLSEDDGGLLRDPAGLGRLHAAQLNARAALSGIRLWEGLNERNPTTPEMARAVCAYELARVQALNARGLGAVVCNFGVGHPTELADGSIDWAELAPLLGELPPGNYLGVHEYWLPRPGGPLHPDNLYHRSGRVFRCPFDVPILVTECGIDVAGGAGDGWAAHGLTAVEYAAQLGEYARLMGRDPRVKAGCVFTFGHNPPWQAFDIAGQWEAFVEVMRPGSPPSSNGVRVLYEGQVLALDVEEYLRGVVPSELAAEWLRMPNGAVVRTETEALKAQAVAARGYALWRRVHPRGESFDLWADARDQVYNPRKAHPRSDEAIRSTAGVYVVEADGSPSGTQYVSLCGRADCLYCLGAGGYDGRTWPFRACQFGMQRMAEQGAGWREILAHYYTGARFSDGQPAIPRQKPVEVNPMGKTLYKDPHSNAPEVDSAGRLVGNRLDIRRAEDYWGRPIERGARVFRVVSVQFMNEYLAEGLTATRIIVLDPAGREMVARVSHAWPRQKAPAWDGKVFAMAIPGRPAEFAQGEGNYASGKHGPLGPYVYWLDSDGTGAPLVSDVVEGAGLDGNRHVYHIVTFQECAAYTDDVYPAPPGEQPTTPGGCGRLLSALVALLERLAK